MNLTTEQDVLDFVVHHGIVLESGVGPVPCLSEAIAGVPISGSWWSHPAGKTIFRLTRTLRDSDDVLVCKAINGKITFIHKRLWPALVRLSDRIGRARLDRVAEIHTATGKHELETIRYPLWVPADIMETAPCLKLEEARASLKVLLESA